MPPPPRRRRATQMTTRTAPCYVERPSRRARPLRAPRNRLGRRRPKRSKFSPMRDYDYEDEPYVVIEKSSGGLSSFLIGLAVGAGLALLFAPQSGEETRRRISRSAKRVRDAAEDAVDQARTKVGETFETARQRVEEKIDAARGAFEVKREQVQR